jgi:hypothetical protein
MDSLPLSIFIVSLWVVSRIMEDSPSKEFIVNVVLKAEWLAQLIDLVSSTNF